MKPNTNPILHKFYMHPFLQSKTLLFAVALMLFVSFSSCDPSDQLGKNLLVGSSNPLPGDLSEKATVPILITLNNDFTTTLLPTFVDNSSHSARLLESPSGNPMSNFAEGPQAELKTILPGLTSPDSYTISFSHAVDTKTATSINPAGESFELSEGDWSLHIEGMLVGVKIGEGNGVVTVSGNSVNAVSIDFGPTQTGKGDVSLLLNWPADSTNWAEDINSVSAQFYPLLSASQSVVFQNSATSTLWNQTAPLYPIGGYSSGDYMFYLKLLDSDGKVIYRVSEVTKVFDNLTTLWNYTIVPEGANTLPRSPSALGGSIDASGDFYLEWSDNSLIETSFVIEYSSDNLNFIVLNDTLPLSVGSGLINNTTHSGRSIGDAFWYRVKAVNRIGESSPSSSFFMESEPYLYISSSYGGTLHDGTKTRPFNTVAEGIVKAQVVGVGEIRIAVGIYNSANRLDLIEGISLCGGYNSDFSDRQYMSSLERENVSWKTQLVYSGSEIGNIAAETPAATIYAGSLITSVTMIEGVVISGRTAGDLVSALWCDNGAAPLIQFSTLLGGSSAGSSYSTALFCKNGSHGEVSSSVLKGGSADDSTAVRLLSSSPLIDSSILEGGGGVIQSSGIMMSSGSAPEITFNQIDAGGSVGNLLSVGIAIKDSEPYIEANSINGGLSDESIAISISALSVISPVIVNNYLNGGSGSSTSSGVTCEPGSPYIVNNSISGGNSSGSAVALFLSGISEPAIINNHLYTEGTTGYAVYESEAESDPETFSNNNLFSAPDGLYYDFDLGVSYHNMFDINQLTDIVSGVSNNIRIPVTINANGSLSQTPPYGISFNGVDLSAEPLFPVNDSSLPTDISGISDRGANGLWSIGCKEYDSQNPFSSSLLVNVTTAVIDSNYSSLSITEAILLTNAGGYDSILFHPAVNGSEIKLLETLYITSDLTISGPGLTLLTLSGDLNNSSTSNAGDIQQIVIDNLNVGKANVIISGIEFKFGAALAGSLIESNENLDIRKCAFVSSASSGSGGAVLLRADSFISQSLFIDNMAVTGGGAIRIEGAGTLVEIEDSLFFGNKSDGGGAVTVASGSSLDLTGCSFSQNSDLGLTTGETLFNDNSDVEIYNSLFFSSLPGFNLTYIGSGSASVNHSGLSGGWDPNYSSSNSLLTDPGFRNPFDPLGADTIALTLDDGLQLLPWSEAVNQGDNSFSVSTEDITGSNRLRYTTIDAGAYELITPWSSAVEVTVGCNENGIDRDDSAGDLSLPEALLLVDKWATISEVNFNSNYLINLNETLNLNRNITISGESVGIVEINGGGIWNDLDMDKRITSDEYSGGIQLFVIDDGDGGVFSDVELNNLRLTGGNCGMNIDSSGGAIMSFENLKLVDMELIENSAGHYGGAVAVENGDLYIENSIFKQNSVDNTLVSENSGGALALSGGSLTVFNSIFSHNHVGFAPSGSAIFLEDGSSLLINNSFTGHIASGGMISEINSSVIMKNSLLVGNNFPELALSNADDSVSYSMIESGFPGVNNFIEGLSIDIEGRILSFPVPLSIVQGGEILTGAELTLFPVNGSSQPTGYDRIFNRLENGFWSVGAYVQD